MVLKLKSLKCYCVINEESLVGFFRFRKYLPETFTTPDQFKAII